MHSEMITKPTMISIFGGMGSGKSTFVDQLERQAGKFGVPVHVYRELNPTKIDAFPQYLEDIGSKTGPSEAVTKVQLAFLSEAKRQAEQIQKLVDKGEPCLIVFEGGDWGNVAHWERLRQEGRIPEDTIEEYLNVLLELQQVIPNSSLMLIPLITDLDIWLDRVVKRGDDDLQRQNERLNAEKNLQKQQEYWQARLAAQNPVPATWTDDWLRQFTDATTGQQLKRADFDHGNWPVLQMVDSQQIDFREDEVFWGLWLELQKEIVD